MVRALETKSIFFLFLFFPAEGEGEGEGAGGKQLRFRTAIEIVAWSDETCTAAPQSFLCHTDLSPVPHHTFSTKNVGGGRKDAENKEKNKK